MAGRSSKIPLNGLREQLAQEAARLMIESGIEDFGLAKRKAADRLGVTAAGALPSNAQIETSLAERQRIFEPHVHQARLASLRRLAADIMGLLEAFSPRLVGPVLAGTATANSTIELHAFTDTPESVAMVLETSGIAVRDCERRYRFGSQQRAVLVPGYSFVRGGERVVVLTFGERQSHHAPLSPVDQRPMKRAAKSEVLSLL